MAETNIHSRFTEAKFYPRTDTPSWDFELGDLTTDGTWRDLDLSSIVPEGARYVFLAGRIRDEDAVGSEFGVRKNGDTGIDVRKETSLAALDHWFYIGVSCDENRVIEYYAANVTWTRIEFRIQGWLK